MWCSNTYQTLNVVTWSHEIFYGWNLRFILCASQNTGECQTPTADSWGGNINEYMPNLLTMSFCDGFNNSKTESGGLSEGKKSPLIARLYGNTRIMTLLKWINWWYCIDKDWWWTNADFMRHRLELFINSNTFFFALYKKPTCKTIDEMVSSRVT